MPKRKEGELKVKTLKEAEAMIEEKIKLPVELGWKNNGWLKN